MVLVGSVAPSSENFLVEAHGVKPFPSGSEPTSLSLLLPQPEVLFWEGFLDSDSTGRILRRARRQVGNMALNHSLVALMQLPFPWASWTVKNKMLHPYFRSVMNC